MGKAPKRITILVTEPSMLKWPEVEKLVLQGHTVGVLAVECDLVLGPCAWQMTEELKKYLPLAIKGGRDRKYGDAKKGIPQAEDSEDEQPDPATDGDAA